jgi:hypothetical protein
MLYASHAVLYAMRYISLSFDFKFRSKLRDIWMENQGRKSSCEDLGGREGQYKVKESRNGPGVT